MDDRMAHALITSACFMVGCTLFSAFVVIGLPHLWRWWVVPKVGTLVQVKASLAGILPLGHDMGGYTDGDVGVVVEIATSRPHYMIHDKNSVIVRFFSCPDKPVRCHYSWLQRVKKH